MAYFLSKCIRDSDDENFCHKCLEELKFYAFDIDSINMIKFWMLDEHFRVLISGQKLVTTLQFREKISLLKLLQASQFVSGEDKKKIADKIGALIAKGKVYDDLVSLCDWSQPVASYKEILWNQLTD